jgi:hypothetical protein
MVNKEAADSSGILVPTYQPYNLYHITFLGVKQPRRGIDHPPPSSTKVKERVELYLYSPSGPSRPVIG